VSGAGCPLDPATAEVLAVLRRTFQRPGPDGSITRQFHVKTHACLRGVFQVEPADDPALRHGLFATPGRYPAVARFSSSFFEDDRTADGRGLAIKLEGVEGEVCDGAPAGQQDFVLLDQPTQPFRTAADALALFRVLDGRSMTPARLLAPGYTFPGWNPRRVRWHYLRLLLATGWGHARNRDLARSTFYSGTPYRLGEGAARYVCRPAATSGRRRPARGRDFRERLQNALDAGPLTFDFLLQPRVRADDRLDDAAQAWRSPLVRVGRLEIAPQAVEPGRPLGDRLSFSPWNCLSAHEPLGSVNALRRHAYAASAAARAADPAFPRTPGE
jgi:hypothetical protein